MAAPRCGGVGRVAVLHPSDPGIVYLRCQGRVCDCEARRGLRQHEKARRTPSLRESGNRNCPIAPALITCNSANSREGVAGPADFRRFALALDGQ
jgi:hypothetical protein